MSWFQGPFRCAPRARSSVNRFLASVELLGGLLIFVSATITLAATGESNSRRSEARLLFEQKKWAEAVVILRPVFKAQPTARDVGMDLSRALLFSGRREEALSVLQEMAAGASGTRREHILRRAQVASRQFLTAETQKLYQEGLNFMWARKFKQAREQLELALSAESDNVEILTRQGQCLAMEGEADSAAEVFRRARRLAPAEPAIRMWLGRMLHLRGELAEAVTEIQAGRAGLPLSEAAPVWLADAMVSTGKREQAIALLEADVQKNPMHVQSLLALARLYLFSPALPLVSDGAALGDEVQPAVKDAPGGGLWQARKKLQLATSRLGEYRLIQHGRNEGELGLVLRTDTETQASITELSSKVESQIQQARSRRE